MVAMTGTNGTRTDRAMAVTWMHLYLIGLTIGNDREWNGNLIFQKRIDTLQNQNIAS